MKLGRNRRGLGEEFRGKGMGVDLIKKRSVYVWNSVYVFR